MNTPHESVMRLVCGDCGCNWRWIVTLPMSLKGASLVFKAQTAAGCPKCEGKKVYFDKTPSEVSA